MAGGIDWFRWHHGSVNDQKFPLVAKRAGASVAEVIAVWACLLESASMNEERRGALRELPDFESMDCALGLPDGRSQAIYDAMQKRNLVDEDMHLPAWTRRQPQREDTTAADRKRAQREREAAAREAAEREAAEREAAERDATSSGNANRDAAGQTGTDRDEGPCHALSRDVTTEERREEKSYSEAKASAVPSTPKDRIWSIGIALLGEKGRGLLGQLVAKHGEAVVDRAIASAAREQPGEPKAWLVKACETEAAAQRKADQLGGYSELLDDPKPAWAIDAGFRTRFDAENEGCSPRNAHLFRDGRKLQ